MSRLRWHDFSGAPPILIAERDLPAWNGFYQPCPDAQSALNADLILPDGRSFVALSDVDFDQPQSDYERLCLHSFEHLGHSLYPLGDSRILVISDYSDGSVGWWSEQRMLITVSQQLPQLARLDPEQWEDALTWDIPPGKVYLMNSCEHGANPDKQPADLCELDLPPGRYRIESYDYDLDSCMMLYRFTALASP